METKSHILAIVQVFEDHIDLDSDDYVELYGYADVASSGTWNLNQDGTTSNNRVFWFGYKLIT